MQHTSTKPDMYNKYRIHFYKNSFNAVISYPSKVASIQFVTGGGEQTTEAQEGRKAPKEARSTGASRRGVCAAWNSFQFSSFTL